jgi:predicted metal-dependent hydrolase
MAQLAQHHQTSASDIDALDVRLPCLDEIWHHADGQWIEQQTGIAVQFATTQAQQHWVVQRATPYLTLRLAELAAQHELVYRHCRVSRMRSRWGSCSASAKIHLNAGLVFLDTTQIDYVLLHELCHTKQMNHSVAFWQEMMRVCPDFARLRGSLKRMRLPQWWMEMS